MGRRAHLMEISARLFADLARGATFDRETLEQLPTTFLDKSWYELHLLFREMESPLCRIISGEREYPPGWPTFEAFIDERGEDGYIALTSPSLVREIAAALAALSESDIIRISHEKGIALDSYTSKYLEELKATYSLAAVNGSGLCITIT